MRITQSWKYRILYDYQIHDSILNSVDHCKCLGVTLQSNLWWSKHIEGITAQVNSTLSMIRRNIKKTSKQVKIQIYHALIRPQLENASSAWSPWLKQDISELEKVQHCAVYFVHNIYCPLASVIQMNSALGWETLEACHQKLICACCSRLLMVSSKSHLTTTNHKLLKPYLIYQVFA